MRLATWNVNSITARLPHVLAFLERCKPDVLCLQETKCTTDKFPSDLLRNVGYHSSVYGQKAYNGVAILSLEPSQNVRTGLGSGFDSDAARVIAASVGKWEVMNIYAPNGQAVGSDKYVYKLEWFGQLGSHLRSQVRPTDPLIIAGDFNVAPEPRDVHDPQLWQGQILFSEPERQALAELQKFGLVDLMRIHEAGPGPFTWWDYRAASFRRNLGLRIDLILATEVLANRCRRVWVERDERGADRPSDHAPVLAEFE